MKYKCLGKRANILYKFLPNMQKLVVRCNFVQYGPTDKWSLQTRVCRVLLITPIFPSTSDNSHRVYLHLIGCLQITLVLLSPVLRKRGTLSALRKDEIQCPTLSAVKHFICVIPLGTFLHVFLFLYNLKSFCFTSLALYGSYPYFILLTIVKP